MRAVWRKSIGDQRSRPWQAALVFLTAAAAATLLYVGLVSLQASSSPYERLLERTNGPHVYFVLKDNAEGEQMAGRLAGWPGVTGASPVWRSAVVQLQIPGTVKTPSVRLVGRPSAEPEVGRYIITAGRDLLPSDHQAGIMDASMAMFYGVKPGDTVQVPTPRGPSPLTIVGLQSNSLELAYPWFDPVSVYVAPDTLDSLALATHSAISLTVGMRLADQAAADRFQADVKKALAGSPGGDPILGSMDWKFMKDGFRSIHMTSMVFTMAFGLMAVIASALITANVVGAAVLAQFKEIGVLKALGFTGWQVLAVFGGQNWILGLLGGLAGVAAGWGLAGRQMWVIAAVMGTPEVIRLNLPVASTVVFGISSVAAIFAVLASLRAIVLPPVAVLGEGFAAPVARPSLAARVLARLRAPLPVVLGVKDASSRPARQALTVASLVICLAIIVATAGFSTLVRDLPNRPDIHGLNWDLYASPLTMTMSELQTALDGDTSVEAYYPAVQVLATDPKSDFTFKVTAAGGGWTAFPFTLLEGRYPSKPGEIMLAPGAMNRTGAKVGDRIKVQLGGYPAELTVTGVYRYLMNLSQNGFTTLETLQQINPKAKGTFFAVRLRPGTVPEEAQRTLLSATNYRAEVSILDKTTYFKSMTDVARMAAVMGLLMAGIAALGVLNATLLTVREQVREIGIRKAAGMTPFQTLTASVSGAAWLGILGTAIGLPLGRFLGAMMAAGMARQFAMGPLRVEMPLSLTVVLATGWVGLAVVGAIPAVLWAGRLPTATALRAE